MVVHDPEAGPSARSPVPLGTLLGDIARGIVLADAQGEIVHADAGLARLTGLANEQLLGRAVETLCEPGDDAAAGQVRAAIAAGQRLVRPARCQRADGSVAQFELTVLPIRNSSGAVTMVAIELRDPVLQRAIDQELQQSQRLQARGQFTSAVAHDFNNLLTVVSGHIGLIEAGGEASPAVLEALREMAHAVERGTALTRQLLTSTTRHATQFRVLDLNEIVMRMAGMLGRVVGNTVCIETRPLPQPAWVFADAAMLDQVLMNLCLNARDAMPAGGTIELIVERIRAPAGHEPGHQPPASATAVAESRPTAHVRLTVADNGAGIPPENRELVFEPFFTTKRAGSGLGLATVVNIVRQHDGFCDLESEIGRGTRFHVWLPEARAPRGRSRPAPAAAAPVQGGVERLLVVEHDPDVAVLLQRTLVKAGYRVRSAETSHQALEQWRELGGAFDLLLTDTVMPEGMNGAELADRLAREKPGLAVVMVGDNEPPRCQPGGRTFLLKPFSRHDLLRVVRDALGAGARPPGAGGTSVGPA